MRDKKWFDELKTRPSSLESTRRKLKKARNRQLAIAWVSVILILSDIGLVFCSLFMLIFHKNHLGWNITLLVSFPTLMALPATSKWFYEGAKARVRALEIIKEDQEETCRNAPRVQPRRTV